MGDVDKDQVPREYQRDIAAAVAEVQAIPGLSREQKNAVLKERIGPDLYEAVVAQMRALREGYRGRP